MQQVHSGLIKGIYYELHPPSMKRGNIKNNSELLLFLHGFFGSHASWNAVVEPLCKAGYTCLTIDLPGFGNSEKGPQSDYGHRALSTRLNEMLIELMRKNISNTWFFVHVIGNGFGGRIALSMALFPITSNDKTFNLCSIILVGATVHQPPTRLLFLIPGMTWLFRTGLHYYWSEHRFKRDINTIYAPTGADDELLAERWSRFSQQEHLDTVVWMTRDAWKDLLNEKLSSAPCDVCLIWGEEDPMEELPLAQEMFEKCQQRVKDDVDENDRLQAELMVIKGAGQFPHEQKPVEFVDCLLRWLLRSIRLSHQEEYQK